MILFILPCKLKILLATLPYPANTDPGTVYEDCTKYQAQTQGQAPVNPR